jgi:hypothetical protein
MIAREADVHFIAIIEHVRFYRTTIRYAYYL